MLTIRDPQARRLARQLADQRHITMTAAVVSALEEVLQRESVRVSLADRVAVIAGDLARHAGPNRREMTKDEIDAMWGH